METYGKLVTAFFYSWYFYNQGISYLVNILAGAEYLISYLCTYDLYGPVRNAFDAGSIHYEGKWEGVWALDLTFLGPKCHTPIGLMPCHRAQKSLDFHCTNPLPLVQVMDAAVQGRINHRCIGGGWSNPGLLRHRHWQLGLSSIIDSQTL